MGRCLNLLPVRVRRRRHFARRSPTFQDHRNLAKELESSYYFYKLTCIVRCITIHYLLRLIRGKKIKNFKFKRPKIIVFLKFFSILCTCNDNVHSWKNTVHIFLRACFYTKISQCTVYRTLLRFFSPLVRPGNII